MLPATPTPNQWSYVFNLRENTTRMEVPPENSSRAVVPFERPAFIDCHSWREAEREVNENERRILDEYQHTLKKGANYYECKTKRTKKKKNVTKEVVVRPSELPGYRGNEDIDVLIKFLEGGEGKEKFDEQKRKDSITISSKKGRKMSHTRDADDVGAAKKKKKSKKRSHKKRQITEEKKNNVVSGEPESPVPPPPELLAAPECPQNDQNANLERNDTNGGAKDGEKRKEKLTTTAKPPVFRSSYQNAVPCQPYNSIRFPAALIPHQVPPGRNPCLVPLMNASGMVIFVPSPPNTFIYGPGAAEIEEMKNAYIHRFFQLESEGKLGVFTV